APASAERTARVRRAADRSAVPGSMLRPGGVGVSGGGVGWFRRRARAGPGPRVVLAREPREGPEPGGFSPVSSRLTDAPPPLPVSILDLGTPGSPRRRGEGAAPALGFGSGRRRPTPYRPRLGR